MTIVWSSFSWEAFATLLTGLAAVIAAWSIGRRQLKIQEQAQRFHETQTTRDFELSTQTFRNELLDRRVDCITKIRSVSSAWSRNSRINDEEWQELIVAFQQAQLIFPKSISDSIGIALESSFRQRIHENRSQDLYKRGNQEKAQEHQEKAFEAEDQLMEAMLGLLDRMINATRIHDTETSELS